MTFDCLRIGEKPMKTLIAIVRSVVALAGVAGRNFLSVQFILEFTENLSPSSWRTETSAQSIEADRRMITAPMADQNRFYRLRGLQGRGRREVITEVEEKGFEKGKKGVSQ